MGCPHDPPGVGCAVPGLPQRAGLSPHVQCSTLPWQGNADNLASLPPARPRESGVQWEHLGSGGGTGSTLPSLPDLALLPGAEL